MSGGNGTKILVRPRKGPPEMRGLMRRHIDLPGDGNLVILPAHAPVAVSRRTQAAGQVPTLTTA
jgi:hypothetical protein